MTREKTREKPSVNIEAPNSEATSKDVTGEAPDSEDKANEEIENLFNDWKEVDDTREATIRYNDEDEDMDTIKARTMWNMVENLPGDAHDCARKLMFLSGKQADLIASSPGGIKKMLKRGFGVTTPRLVINLLYSLGLSDQNCPRLESRSAAAKIDQFMADVIIPMAEETNAVILCSAEITCGLSCSLTRVMALMRAKWGARPPFTVISGIGEIRWLYLKGPKNGGTWRQICASSRAWTMRERAGLKELLVKERMKISGPTYETDIDKNATNLIIVDPSSKTELSPPNHNKHYTNLLTETCRYLMSTLPSLTLKTGYCSADGFSGLQMALQSTHLGSPVLLLDCCERPLPTEPEVSRDEIIKWAIEEQKKQIENRGDPVYSCYYSAMALAWLHEIFNLDGNAGTVEFVNKGPKDQQMQLHEAIRRKNALPVGESMESSVTGMCRRATTLEREKLLEQFCDKFFEAEHLVRVDMKLKTTTWDEEKQNGRLEEKKDDLMLRASMLLDSKSLHAVNLQHAKSQDTKKLVDSLVRLDRLPAENSLEGLQLLKQAWEEHDIAKYLAGRYKLFAKLLFLVQLLLAFATVCGASVAHEQDTNSMHEVVFGLAICSSFLASLDAFINAKSKWRQLRTYQGTLESVIWQYRCRVAQFAADGMNATLALPEANLQEALVAWRVEMAAGADLHNSNLRKQYRATVFKHGQRDPEDTLHAAYTIFSRCKKRRAGTNSERDDHFSPVDAETYVEMRLRPAVAWYQKRIPVQWTSRIILKLCMLFASVVSAILARHALSKWVAIVTAGATAVTSWSEFSDSGSKIERYNRVIESIQNLLTWWYSINPVDKASKPNVAHLVLMGESILLEERLAWQSTLRKQRKEDETHHKEQMVEVAHERREDQVKSSNSPMTRRSKASVTPSPTPISTSRVFNNSSSMLD